VTSPIRVTVWGENFHEQSERDRAGMAERYPDGMHGAIAAGITELLGDSVTVVTATQDQPQHGLTEEVLNATDVLTWWGHATHAGVDDAVVDRVHPITAGIPHPIVINEHEMYGEFFDIPAPDELIFLSTFSSGEVFRSGCCWRRGKGKVFYFSPGDQEYPVYQHPDIKRVLANAVLWARSEQGADVEAPSVVNQPAPLFDRRLIGEQVGA
jgi:trehalose utilization protein